MIETIKYKELTAEEAVWTALRANDRVAGQIANLRKGDNLTVQFPITITVDTETAKRVLKEFFDENSNY